MYPLVRSLLLYFILCGCAVSDPVRQLGVQPAGVASPSYRDVLETLEFQALGPAYSTEQVATLLAGQLAGATAAERTAAAVLISSGAINAADLALPALAKRKLEHFVAVMTDRHPALLGRVGSADLLSRLSEPLDYTPLLAATAVRGALGSALADGVITGYDLRLEGVFDHFPPSQTFIYSHSELLHVRQLVVLLAREGINAWVYLTPKISAFLYREDWGNAGSNVVRLANGVRVVQGREIAVLFRFDSPDDRQRFQAVVNSYAKRDSKEETGLIAGAWWQPFYYTDTPLPTFEPISLVVMTANNYEATLTVVDEKAQSVIDTLATSSWPTRRERVWVNPAFYRFLNGDYK